MQHLSAQDILAIMGSILGPIITLLGFMWHHFNGQFKEIKGEVNDMRGEMKDMEIRLVNKIDALYLGIKY